MTFPIDVTDDGSPRAALDVAGQAVRAFNHRSGQRFAAQRLGWNYAPDVYRCVGELTYMIGMLPQVCQHMIESMRAQLNDGHLAIDRGTRFEAHPEIAIDATCAALADVRQTAQVMASALSKAQIAVNAASYIGPEHAATASWPEL